MKNAKMILKWALILTVIMNFYPVSYSITRALTLFMWPILIISFASFYLSKRFLLIGTAVLLCTLGLILCREEKIESLDLQGKYLTELKSYEGTYYVWGGENFIGIDCSGLARRAMINALFKELAIKKAIEIWYYDSSAKALMESYRALTVDVCQAKSINSLDHSLIKAGDLAITTNGVHVMIYLGDQEWIEADPTLREVIRIKAPQKSFAWFESPVIVKRWSLLK